MTYPVPWHNELGFGLTLGPVPDPTWDMSFDGVDYPPDYVPEKACEGGKPTCMDNWMYEAGDSEAFTNYTFIPGEPTLPEDMYDLGGGVTLQGVLDERCPWTSPGSAPIFGNGCGAAGGNPYGCLCNDFEAQEAGAFGCYGDDDRLYGYCCGAPRAADSDNAVRRMNFFYGSTSEMKVKCSF